MSYFTTTQQDLDHAVEQALSEHLYLVKTNGVGGTYDCNRITSETVAHCLARGLSADHQAIPAIR